MGSITLSTKETNRFKMNIYRGVVDRIDLKELKDVIINNKADIVILRVPTENAADQDKLERLGFNFICADTLIYYTMDLEQSKISPLRNNDIQFHVASSHDFETIDFMIREIFADYTNHYNSNHYIDKEHITEGYQEWVKDFISKSEGDGRISWIVKNGDVPVAFATCSYEEEKRVCEGVLYGVVPEHGGRGIYTDLIRYTKNYFKEKGYKDMKVSTQVQNVAVQKVWTREGYGIEKSYNTFHINSLLDFSVIEPVERSFTITEAEVQKYGEATGDFNPIHFDENFAKANKLKGKIAHGIITNAMLTKYYGMEYPGNGTMFMSYNYLFYKPIYLNETYRMIITFPVINAESGTYKSVAKILDSEGNVCMITYNNLMKRKS